MQLTKDKAFTLVETLVVVAVLALLVGIAATALFGSRQSAVSSRHLANLRSHSQVVASYAIDFAGNFPCVTNPYQNQSVFETPSGPYECAYFDVRITWWMGLFERYYQGQFNSPVFFAQRSPIGWTDPYWYSLSCVAQPQYWNFQTRTRDGQVGAVRLDQTSFPSRKGLFLNSYHPTIHAAYWEPDARLEASFVDGHAKLVRMGDLRGPVRSGEGPRDWPRARLHIGIPIVHTLDGVSGWDTN